MTRSITLLALGLILAALVCSIPAGAVVTPSPGRETRWKFCLGFTRTRRPTRRSPRSSLTWEIWWHESTYNHTHEYVYIVPANDCEEQLVYLNRIRADEHGGEQSIGQTLDYRLR